MSSPAHEGQEGINLDAMIRWQFRVLHEHEVFEEAEEVAVLEEASPLQVHETHQILQGNVSSSEIFLKLLLLQLIPCHTPAHLPFPMLLCLRKSTQKVIKVEVSREDQGNKGIELLLLNDGPFYDLPFRHAYSAFSGFLLQQIHLVFRSKGIKLFLAFPQPALQLDLSRQALEKLLRVGRIGWLDARTLLPC
jgi:hypothetical protein